MIAIYARVSTEEQAKKGYSLQDQLRECRKFADIDNAVREYVDDGISGEFLDRLALTRLRKDIKDGIITKVICLDPDRLSRKLMNQLLVSDEIEKRAKLVFVNGEYKNTPEGILFYQMRGAISEFEKAKINERMCRGRREKARQGRVVRDYSIYGYDYEADKEQLIINKYEAEVVKLIFNFFTCRDRKIQGINGIAKFLNERGVPTKRGAGIWHRQVVRQILFNHAYIGEFYQNRWNTEGMLGNKFKKPDERISMRERPKEEWILVPCPSIVDREVFNYAQKLLQESRRRWAGTCKNEYLLSGLVRCGLCDNTMTGVKTKNWGKHVLVYTDFKGTQGAKNKGCGNRIRVEELDQKVWNVVSSWLSQNYCGDCSDMFDEDKTQESFELIEKSRIESKLDEIKKERKNLISLMARTGDDLGDDGFEEIRLRLKQLKDEEEQFKKQLEEMTTKTEVTEQFELKKNLLVEAKEYYLSKSPDEITFYDKRELIRYLVREVKVFKEEIKVFGF